MKEGFNVSIPFGQNCPYDFVAEKNHKFYRIQVKTTQKVHEDGKMEFKACRTNGFTGKHIPYTKDEIDFIVVYCIKNNYLGLLPISNVEGKTEVIIRTQKTRNNQIKNVRMAEDYLFDKQVKNIT